jgi:O-acetyl-ADP-ribose deacetylase (regulator of RNase III)
MNMKTIKGDLLALAEQGEFDLVLHGCNCYNIMGGGIAAQIAQRWPDARLADDETVKGDPGKLGSYTLALHGDLKILNCYTQYSISRDGQDVFEYAAFERVLSKIALRWGCARIGLPLIGMGLAGGDAGRIMPLIEGFASLVERRGGTVTLVEWARK